MSAALPQDLLDRYPIEAYWDIGSAVVGSDEERTLERCIVDRQFEEATRLAAANQLSDIRAWVALRMANHSVAIVKALLRIDMWADDDWGEPVMLEGTDALALERAAGDSWHPIA